MLEYTLTLNSREDYRVLKKILKAFDGASIKPVRKRKSSIELSLDDARKGNVVGPFYSVEAFMKDLIN